jgi:hypothetical protein
VNPFAFIRREREKFEADKRRVRAAMRLMCKKISTDAITPPTWKFRVTDTGFWILEISSLRVELRERNADDLIRAAGCAHNVDDLAARLLDRKKRVARARAAGVNVR